MNTTENNVLIAKFMQNITIDMNDNIKEDLGSFKYHIDWNWLMEVVEKIENMGGAVCIGNGNSVMIIFYLTDVMGESYSKTREMVEESKIEATYNACVEFIKWYNENKI
jgi:hypothetical protein